MAKKRVAAIVKIQIPAGKASPAPPVGTALGPHGVGIMDFVKAYNAATESQTGTIVPVEITVFEDRTFTFVLKTPPTPVLLREKAGLDRASSTPGRTKAGSVTEDQVAEIVPCGPDAARHLAKIADYVDAGYDHVYIHQIGPDQTGFIKFAEGELLPALKPGTLRLAS